MHFYTFIYRERLKSLAKESWSVCWPMTLIMFFEFLMGLADVYVAGKINKEVQAAYGLAFQLYFVGLIPAIALTSGTVSVISKLFTASGCDKDNEAPRAKARGFSQTLCVERNPDHACIHPDVTSGWVLSRRDKDINNYSETAKLDESVFSSSLASFVLGIVASAVGIIFLPLIIKTLKVPQVLKGYSSLLVVIYSFGFIVEYFLITSNGILRSCGKIKISLRNYSFMCVLNIILNFVLAFKTPLGYLGIGVATVISVCFAAALNLFAMRSRFGQKKFNFNVLKSMFNIGWPIGVLQILWSLAIVVIFSILGALPVNSVEIIAAFTNGLKVESVIFLPAFAFNLANAVVVGNLLGQNKKDEAYSSGFITAILGMMLITLLSVIVILSARYLMPFLSSNGIVIENSLYYIYISLMLEPVMAWGVILGGGLAGAGYTKDVLISIILGVWVIRVPLCYFMGLVWAGGAIGVWWAINISIIFQSVFISWRYIKKMRPAVVEK